jgi:hypothetical protein
VIANAHGVRPNMIARVDPVVWSVSRISVR